MKWGEVYRSREPIAKRGHKPGFYVVVSRDFIASNDDVSTVICAPVYSEILGLRTEVAVGTDDGLPRDCAIRCDFLMLMFKRQLTGFVSTLPRSKQASLREALAIATQIDP